MSFNIYWKSMKINQRVSKKAIALHQILVNNSYTKVAMGIICNINLNGTVNEELRSEKNQNHNNIEPGPESSSQV